MHSVFWNIHEKAVTLHSIKFNDYKDKSNDTT